MSFGITITGKVVELADDYKAVMLVLEQHDGVKTNTVAVRCWSDSLKQRAEGFKRGDMVEAFGKISSRKGSREPIRWFTSFEAEGLRAVNEQKQEPPPEDDGEDYIR